MKTTPIDERISALVDGETAGIETRRGIQELLKDDERRERWTRYHLIGDVLREPNPAIPTVDFAASVMARIAAEAPAAGAPVTPAAADGRPPVWMKPLVGMAIAASVAVVSILTLKTLTGQPELPVPVAQDDSGGARNIQVPALAVPTANQPGGPADQPLAQPPEALIIDPNLPSYVSTHAEFAAQPSLLPEARVVGFGEGGE